MNAVRRIWRPAGSIRVRLQLWYGALLAVILLAFSVLLYLPLSRGLREELDVTLSTEAARLIASMDFENNAPQLGEAPDNLRIGTVAARSDSTGRAPPAPRRSRRVEPGGAGAPDIRDRIALGWYAVAGANCASDRKRIPGRHPP